MPDYYTTMHSPIGEIVITSNGEAITGLYTPEHKNYEKAQAATRDPRPFKNAIAQLEEYFAGARRDFDLPVAASGTAFQQKIWQKLRAIPAGETTSYGKIAISLDMPKASRAVGNANGKNPLSIIVPCHRVIAANGGLGGYNGALKNKQWLLDHERRISGGKI